MKEIKYICHDCSRELEEGEEFMQYHGDFIKCRKCHEIDPVLRNYQECEVYSRCVGYIRPVYNWNEGKKAEFKDRKVFKPKFDEFKGNDVY
jgi:anaerobic ribonucleoside-triphosphate reductase